ncbi:LysE family translocator [Radicibacter daui]|uniref:LysE family translocator n=1 Tax=Radicibacter daui TaxID=3064829 RepID=UPI004046BCDE
MLESLHLPLILSAAFLATASPGPTTLALAGTAMRDGRRSALLLASGVMTGSLFWSVSAAFGLGAIMLANAWVFEIMRYLGGGYLLFLAFKSARSALKPGAAQPVPSAAPGVVMDPVPARRVWSRGLALHITNPKAILFFGSLYAIGVPATARPLDLVTIIALVGLQSACIFHGYALLFSNAAVVRGYFRLRRWFEGAFALAFGFAGLKILTARLH